MSQDLRIYRNGYCRTCDQEKPRLILTDKEGHEYFECEHCHHMQRIYRLDPYGDVGAFGRD